jgi:hypothetical protein
MEVYLVEAEVEVEIECPKRFGAHVVCEPDIEALR